MRWFVLAGFLAWLFVASLASAGSIIESERRLELPGVLVEDFGPDLRYYAAGRVTGRFDDNPRALSVTADGVSFAAGGVAIDCTITPSTTRVSEAGRITTHTRQGGERRSETLTWRIRQLFDLTCTIANVREELFDLVAVGRYLQTRTITLTRGDL